MTAGRRASNPIATPEQAEFERRALQLVRHPRIAEQREKVRAHWLERAAPSPEMRACFERAFEEVMFGAAIWSLNQDPQRPAVVTISRLAHELDGQRVPGSRWGIDNPDSIYRVIPIDGAERYVIRGRVGGKRLTENYFTLWSRTYDTVDVLDGKALRLAPDGSFEISVDADPPGGRPNHVRSTVQAHEFYIRDVLLDWAAERPNRLEVERLGGPPRTPPPGEDEQAERTARFMLDYAEKTLRWNQQALAKPPNVFEFTIDRDTDGALRSQIYVMGHFRLRDDEALVIRVRTGGAAYFTAPITNLWGTTNEIVQRTGSLNNAQSVPDRDGSYTCVVAPRDPGVHNWIDPCEMHEGLMTLRWAEFSGGRPGADLGATASVVPLAALREALPPETRWVTPAERHAQLEARAQSYLWRLAGA